MNDFIYNIIGVTSNKFLQSLIIIVVALLAQTIFHVINIRLIRLPVSKSLVKENNEDVNKRIRTLGSLLGAVITFTIWFIAIVMILGIFGVPMAALITSAGLIGAALAFGLQSIIKDFVSGIFIISENQYRIGDYVVIDKASGSSQIFTAGVVKSISIRATVLKTADGSLLNIPNGIIANTSNYSMGPNKVILNIDIKASYDISKLGKALSQIADKFKNDDNMSKIIIDGPRIAEINNITSKISSVQIVFITDHKNKIIASNTVWQAIKKSTINLA